MKRKRLAPLIAMLTVLFLTGCWDQDYLRDARMVILVGIDRLPGGDILETGAVRYAPTNSGGNPTNTTFQAVGKSIRDARKQLDMRVNGRLRTSKMRTLLLGEEVAKDDIYPILDLIYRDPKASLNAHIAVARGSAQDIVRINQIGQSLIGQYVDEMIDTKVTATLVEEQNIETILAMLLDPGQDFALPYLVSDGRDIKVDGMSMFHGRRMAGTLNPNESMLYLLMKGKKEESAILTLKLFQNKHPYQANFISLDVYKVKSNMNVAVHGKKIEVTFLTKLNVNVTEYPMDHLDKEEKAKKLNQKLTAMLTDQMNHLLNKMQRAHFDGFGVGRNLKAYHYQDWKKIDLEKEYPHIRFQAKADVEIIDHGIIN
ncbi:Ger(x)C family spore germination protein [Laceyella putida]|uniref:Ger(X)C family spore germination protein n=1 Tax=Laceyella putida TaxID=110101 RepID=A0ABW2RJ85_9BACL